MYTEKLREVEKCHEVKMHYLSLLTQNKVSVHLHEQQMTLSHMQVIHLHGGK